MHTINQKELLHFCGNSRKCLGDVLFATSPQTKSEYPIEEVIQALTFDDNYLLNRVNRYRVMENQPTLTPDVLTLILKNIELPCWK